MQNRNNNNQPNKGFTLHLGDTYLGYIVLGEKNVPAETLAKLQDPANMAKILESAELRPFKEKEDTDMSAVDALLNVETEEPSDEPEEETATAAAS